MPNNKYTYMMPQIIRMFRQKCTLKQIANSNAVIPSGCALSRISEIKGLWKEKQIYFYGVGTLDILKSLKSLNDPPKPPKLPERNYDQICYNLLINFMSLKSKIPRYILKDDLKHAYKILSRVVHPDVNKSDPKAQKKFIGLKNAYNYLMNEYFGDKKI